MARSDTRKSQTGEVTETAETVACIVSEDFKVHRNFPADSQGNTWNLDTVKLAGDINQATTPQPIFHEFLGHTMLEMSCH